jgi:predicted nucleic acid-binding protein
VEEIGTQLYEKSGLMLDLSNLCGFFRKTEQWEKLKKYAQIMTEKQPEPISISFLTYALYKTHNYEDCLAVLEKHSHLFLESKLPEHLDRIRIDCLVRLNRLDVAVPHLEKIVEEKPDPILANYLTHAYIQTGKKEKAALFLKESSDTEWADKNLRLKASQILLVDSPDEAFRIAQKAKEVFPDDPDVWMNFIFTGYHTGHDKEASKSLQTFQRKFPESNYLQLINLDEFIKKNQYWREEREDRWKMYVEAKCPAHFLMDLDRQSLGFDWFIRFHINKSEKWEHKYPLFIQCGSQPFVNEETLKKIPDEIIADYTSLLLAQELNILPLIEKAFSKIIIPPSLLAGIHFEVNKSKEFQISRIHVQQNVKKIIDSGKIRLVSESVDKSVLKDYQVNDIGQDEATLFYFATREKGQVLAKHLLRENEKKYSLNSKLIGIRVFPGEALKSLCELGVLAKDDMNEAASQCVNEPCRDSIVQALLRLPKLFIDTLTIEFFAEFNILEKLTQTFDVSMLKTEAEQINRELTGYEFKNDASSWLNGLHHHISGRLNKNYYFPSIHLDTKNKTPERVCSQIFEESFKIAETMNIPLWMDERYARQYLNINQSPIIGTGEILFKLKSKKIISEKEHYRLIFKLLEMNAQFLPLDPKLVMHFLNVASITSQVKIQEIYELKTIRRYIANVFKKASALNKNSNIEGKQPEAVLYYLQHQRICRDLLEMTWIDKTYSLDRKEAISHWIIKHLWKGPDEITHLLQKKSDQKVAASTLQFLLLFVGFNIIFTDVESLDNVSGYFNWLHSHYFKNNWDLNPEIEKLLFQKTNFFVKQLVFDVEKEDKKSIEIWLRILASVLSNLPVKMLDFLLSEKDINDVFSKYLDRTITISENLKIPSSVWKQWAFESIEKGTGKKLQKNLKNYSFTILWQESSLFLAGLCVDFKSEDDKKFKRTHLEPLIKLFHPNSEIRKQFLNELAPYLKISPEKHKKYEEGFTDENDYKKTAKEIEEEAGSSWAYYWGRTADFVKAQIEMGEDLFFPKNPAIFKNYYSLPNRAFENSSEFSEEWNSFVQKKIEMDGIKKALTDILNFPFGNKIALSELLKTVIREEKEHLKDVIDFVSEKALVSSNPVVLQNCLDILLAFQESGPSEKGEIQSILEKLLNPELCKDISELHSLYDFYVTALQFAWSMMKGNNVFKKYSDKEKIIWVYAYAGAMVDVFDNLRKEHNFIFNHSELSKWFIDRAKEQRKDLFENTYNQFLEVSHPEKSSLVRTVISGTLTIILKHKEKLAWFSKELSGKLLNIAKALPKGEIKGSEEIIKPFKLTKNFYGSFFTGNPLIKIKESIEFFNKEPLESFEDADRNAIEKIKSYDLEMILINTLQKIKNVNPCDILDIMCLNIALSEPVAQSNDKLLKDVVTRLDISKFTKEIDFAFACRVLALCVLASSNEDIKKQAIDKLTISFLKEASEIAHYWAILEAVNLIYSNSNAENPAQEFYKWLDEVISKQQCRIPEELYEVIISLSWQTPLSQQQGLAEVKSKLSLIL